MKKLRAGVIVAAIAALQALALVVSAPAQAAWSPPVSPDAPPRVSAPSPTTLKPPTTSIIPNNILKRAPLGLALTLDPLVTGWLQSITGNTANPTLGCVVGGRVHRNESSECGSSAAKPSTPGPNALVMPDTLWGAITGKNLNPLLVGPAPANTSVSQFTPTITAPANGKPGWVAFTWKGKKGSLCSSQPTWYSCPDPNWENSDRGWMGSTATFKVRCKVVANGGFTGQWNGSGNMSAGSSNSMGGMPAGPSDKQVCKDDGTQIVDYVKANAVPAPYPYAPSFAPGVYINPDVEIYKDTTVVTTLNCKNSSGATATVTGSTTGTGQAKQLVCPDGFVPDSGSTSIGNDFLDAPSKVEEWSILPETREQYNECIGWQSAGCIMRVELDGVDCTPGNPACFDWAEIQRLQPSRVKCKWGNYTIDISNCLPLRNGYQSESGVSSVPSQVPGAAPVARDVFGQPLQPNADPVAPPQWQPDYGTPTNPAPNPFPPAQPQPLPTQGTNPDAPPNPNPNPDQPPIPKPGDPETAGRNCFGTSWSWNPVDWVLHPTACALEWAFVPRPSVVQAKGNEIGDKLRTLGLVAPFETLIATVDALPSGAGCEGPTLTFSMRSVTQTMQPINACSGVMNTIANTANAFGSVYLVLFGSISVVRALSSAFGYSFSMGKSVDN